MRDFETMLDDQKTNPMKSVELSESEAEAICTQSDNVRKIVLSLSIKRGIWESSDYNAIEGDGTSFI